MPVEMFSLIELVVLIVEFFNLVEYPALLGIKDKLKVIE
jgi:hypothetical protein